VNELRKTGVWVKKQLHTAIRLTNSKFICVVHAANIHDTRAAKEVFDCLYDLRFDEEKSEKY
jgi:hypothetical protein